MNFQSKFYLLIWGFSAFLIFSECSEENIISVKGCTEIGCSDGFSLIVQPADSLFQEGVYEVSITNDAIGTSTCYFRVSNDSTECASGHCVPEENCNADYAVGYPFPDRVGITYPVIIGPIFVKIRRDGEIIFQTNFNPVYEFIQPNGPGCPPICKVGHETVILD
jgi:hypothetical protein